MTDHSHDQPVEMRTYCFHTFYAFEVNFNAILCRESNSVTSFLFNSSIPCVDQSQNDTM